MRLPDTLNVVMDKLEPITLTVRLRRVELWTLRVRIASIILRLGLVVARFIAPPNLLIKVEEADGPED